MPLHPLITVTEYAPAGVASVVIPQAARHRLLQYLHTRTSSKQDRYRHQSLHNFHTEYNGHQNRKIGGQSQVTEAKPVSFYHELEPNKCLNAPELEGARYRDYMCLVYFNVPVVLSYTGPTQFTLLLLFQGRVSNLLNLRKHLFLLNAQSRVCLVQSCFQET